MTRIVGAPLVKTDDQLRAERRARRERPYAVVTMARGVLWALAMLALVGADRVEAGVRVLVALAR